MWRSNEKVMTLALAYDPKVMARVKRGNRVPLEILQPGLEPLPIGLFQRGTQDSRTEALPPVGGGDIELTEL
jgi:hypothetical protein